MKPAAITTFILLAGLVATGPAASQEQSADNTESSYNWEDTQWTVPLNLTYTVVKHWGKQLVSIGGGGRVYLETPDGGPDWGVRLIVTLLYPR